MRLSVPTEDAATARARTLAAARRRKSFFPDAPPRIAALSAPAAPETAQLDAKLARILAAVGAYYRRPAGVVLARVPQDRQTVMARKAFYYFARLHGYTVQAIADATGRDVSHIGDSSNQFGVEIGSGRAFAALKAITDALAGERPGTRSP